MKKLFLSLVALIMATMSSLTARAERVAPTFPEAQTLESGKTYYLYNVGSQNFIYRFNNAVRADAITKTGIVITDKGDGIYTMQFSDNNSYIRSSSNEVQTQSGQDKYTYFRITEVEGGYTIQRNNNYNETHFVVNISGDVYVWADQTSGNIVWQVFKVDETDHYYAKKALYDALEAATGYEFATADYEAIYENEASTNEELTTAANTLQKALSMSIGYKAPWWNERPILFYTADGNFGESGTNTWALALSSNNSYFYRNLWRGESSSISATVLIEEPSTLVYGLSGEQAWIKVYVDGTEVRSLDNVQFKTYPSQMTYARFFEELEPGLHTITWACTNWSSLYTYLSYGLYNVSVISKPQITVNMLEPGSLGTEVLYNTDHIKNVRRLKVKGAMNNDDWAKIKMMSTLLELDLSESQFTEIPANQFKVSSSDTTMNFLHKVVLPEGVTTIGDRAFYSSFVEDINLPSTMIRVGYEAFRYSHVKELIMPDNMTDFYGGGDNAYCFRNMFWLKKLVLPKNLTRIPDYTFYEDYYITEAVMPEKLQTVGRYAFGKCASMQTTLPEGLNIIEEHGFEDCTTFNSPLPETLTTIGAYAFQNCTNMTKVELNANLYSLAEGVFWGCSNLGIVKLKSPTVTNISDGRPLLNDITAVTIQVPHYLANNYKLHSYWYNAKAIEPFDYSDITYIPIHDNLTLNHERFGGQPSISIVSGYYLKINGDAEQKFQDISVGNDYPNNRYSQILSNCNNLTGYGDNVIRYHTAAQKWYYISLPFDLLVSSIYNYGGAQYAIRYYDGAGRAQNGNGGNWKNYASTDIIPAGTGFIFQTNIDVWSYFPAVDNENKFTNTIGVTEFIKSLAVNASETISNKGWNLVGNPYQCYYNNHCLNFTAPITVWNGSTYVAYSLTDDDYAIRPNEAFFVQCPNEEYNTIGFPLQGRQLTSVIESQNAVKEWAPQAKTRQVVNLTVSNGEMEDVTRVVLNEEASMAYEVSCDASKFMSMDGSVPQIYTLDGEGTWYAINERPIEDGSVALGFYAGQEGTYTISVTRCDAEKVFLTDNLTGETSDITNGSYTFSAKAGTDNTRFTLSFVANDPTAIEDVEKVKNEKGERDVYDLNGRQIVNAKLSQGIYIIRQGKKANKVIIR